MLEINHYLVLLLKKRIDRQIITTTTITVTITIPIVAIDEFSSGKLSFIYWLFIESVLSPIWSVVFSAYEKSLDGSLIIIRPLVFPSTLSMLVQKNL